MLLLARYPQEAILIGEARVTVLDITGRTRGRPSVTLGIEAPPTIPVLRAELLRGKPQETTRPFPRDQKEAGA